jgi:hypothetical protein
VLIFESDRYQLKPEFIEIQIPPSLIVKLRVATATSLFPSALEATLTQARLGAVVGFQLKPELIEV